jgi:hypothetical protein
MIASQTVTMYLAATPEEVHTILSDPLALPQWNEAVGERTTGCFHWRPVPSRCPPRPARVLGVHHDRADLRMSPSSEHADRLGSRHKGLPVLPN